jgi:hypothetical protein
MGVVAVAKSVVGLGDHVAAVSAAIAGEEAAAAAAKKEIVRLESEQLAADEFAIAEKVDRQIAKQRWLIARSEVRLPELRARLTDAEARRQRQAIARHKAALTKAFERLAIAVETAAAANKNAVETFEVAIAELGNVGERHLPRVHFGGMLFQDLVALWRRDIEKQLAPPAPVRQPPASHAAPAVRPAAPAPKAVAPPPAPRQRRGLRRDRPPGTGEVRIVMLRPGVELGGFLCTAGDVVTLAAGAADDLVKAGAAAICHE